MMMTPPPKPNSSVRLAQAWTNAGGAAQVASNSFRTYAGTFTPNTSISPSNISIGMLDQPLWDGNTPSTRPLKAQTCEKLGHDMVEEVEWANGGVFGKCKTCGEVIRGRRIAGGFGIGSLERLLERMLCDDASLTDSLTSLCEQVIELQGLIDAEEAALAHAHSMLKLAHDLLRQRALPAGVDTNAVT